MKKINQYNSLLYRKKSKVTNTYVHGLCGADDQLKNLDVLMWIILKGYMECEGKAAVHDNVWHMLCVILR
jgi:hypothetical protein